jgi:hypothetical protein
MAKQRKTQPVQVVVLPPVYRQRGSEKIRPGSNGVPRANKQNAQRLVQGWSQQYGRPVTIAEVQEINQNLAHFFDLMLSWERQFRQQGLLDDTGKSTAA